MNRRRHKAAGGRIAVTGLSAGAVLGIVGALGAHAVPSTSQTRRVALVAAPPPHVRAPRPSPPTTIVWRVVHRVVYVTDPPATTTRTGGGAAPAHTYRATPSYAAAAPLSPAAVPPVASPTPAPAPAPAPRPAPMPVCSGTKCP